MKENKKVSPSLGVCGRNGAATLTKFKRHLAFLSMLFCMLMATSNAWAGESYKTWLRVATDDTAKGLVYTSKDKDVTVSDEQYKDLMLSDDHIAGSNGANQSFYAWAKPTRGFVFNDWTGYTFSGDESKDGEGAATFPSPKQKTGLGDLIYSKSWGGGAGSDQANSVKASWLGTTSYIVTYKEPIGGTYTVDYNYILTNSSNVFTTVSEHLELSAGSGDKRPYGLEDGSQEGLSYAADSVYLSTEASNFLGWYEDGVLIGDASKKTNFKYDITKAANVSARFRWMVPVAPEIKRIHTTDNENDVDAVVVFAIQNVIVDYTTDNFDVTLEDADGTGTFTLGTYSYNAETKELTIPFTYNANGHFDQGSSVIVKVEPKADYGSSASVLVLAIAQENSTKQARVSGDGFATQEGDLTDMLDVANAHTDATLTLLQDVAVSSPLVVSKSMTLDLNNWILSSTAANKIISVEGTDTKLTISDNSYLKGGEIKLTRNANAAIAAIEVTGNNRLLYNHGMMTVVNNAEFISNANAKAYGIYVSGVGNAVMQGGSIKVESDHDARGVFIASGNGTLNVGKIEATAKSQAYALYSGGKINVAEGISLTAKTTTGSDASALYLTGGTAVVDNVPMAATSAANNAYGANVQGGKLTLNGGTIAATATTAGVYGVYIADSGNVTVQQQATITAEGPGTSALPVFGIQNLGTLKLINSSVTAISTTNYATAVSSMTSAISTTIEGGTYTAQSATGFAYGLHHQFGTLSVDGGTFSAVAAGDKVYGARAIANGSIANATLFAETTGSNNTVYGFASDVAEKSIALTNCTIKAKAFTSAAYAIYSCADVTATNCDLEAKALATKDAYGFYAGNGSNALINASAYVVAYATDAYGIDYVNGTINVTGGAYKVVAHQAAATAATDSKVYGIRVANGKSATLNNASFVVVARNGSYSQNAYGAYTGTGTINSTNCSYSVSASKQAYGIYGAASSHLNLRNNTILASTIGSTNANGIYSAGQFMVDGDNVTTNTKSYSSFPLFFASTAEGEVLRGKFMAQGISTKATQIIAPINTGADSAKVKVKGGFFNDNVQLRYYVPKGYDIYGVDPAAPEYAEEYYYTVNDHLPYENICYVTEVSTGFPTLEEAFDYARNHSGSTYNIIMTQPYILPAGNYSLPSNATLVVPDRASRTTAIGTTAERQFPDQALITENRCLTFSEGVNLDVYGAIEVSAKQYTVNAGRIAYVLGPYGRIHLTDGSTITLNNGAKINAWGYITGQGEIRVKNGAEVREFFQIHDMKAASDITKWNSSNNKSTYKAFLMNQYYIQSIEAPTKYYYGGKLIGSLSITSNATAYTSVDADNVQLVAPSDAFFTVDTDDESAWVRKTYDPTTDRILWETNSSASLGSIAVDGMGSYSFDSKDYTLPFTNNMTIHALSGIFNITQSTVLLPGSEIIIDKTATLNINEKDVNGDDMGFYLYDMAQWGKYYDSSTKYFIPAMYSPSWSNGVCPRGDGKSNACLKDAAIYVKGKITVNSALYTSAGGAAIYSDDTNAGTIEFLADAAADGSLYRTYEGGGVTAVTAAKLRNGGEAGADANMTPTKDVAEAGDTYAYSNIDGTGYKWTRLKNIDDCTIADETDPENPVYYAKPQGYVAITSNTEDENHLFHAAEGEGLFIQQLMDAGCQWWEVTQVEETSVYYCATNDTYYEWIADDLEHPEEGGLWYEVKRTVTFYFTDPKSEDADKKKVLTVNYGAKPDVSIVSNPSKEEDAAATYQFQGWKYGEDGPVHAYTDLESYEPVTENDTYYLPVFTSITKKYTITLNNAKNGETVPVEVFYGSVPDYTATKASTAEFTYTFDYWEPELAEVTGPATYTAYWTSVKNRYNITWVNGETTLEEDKNVLYGAATSYDGALPTKETDNNFVYAFSGWLSSLDGNTYANGSTPTVAGHTTYTAQYATTPRYAISFVNYDGSELQKESVTTGERPVYDEYKYGTPARVRDVDGYYKFTGWKDLSGTFYTKNTPLPAVTDHKETYTAQYDYVTELYLITLKNIDGNGGEWSGKFGVGATPFYDPDGDDIADVPTKAATAQYSYAFSGWSLTQDGAKIDPMPEVSGVATYWALFEESVNKYTITFANVDGNGAEETVEVEYGQTPSCPVTPAKGDNYYTYDFLGWDNTIVAVTGEATYTAQFSGTGTPRTFTITFEPENGGAAEVLSVAYGQMPSPTTPVKDGDAQYSYAFNSWAPALTTVTEDATYYAQYTQTVNRYTIRFENYDGSELQSEYLNYGVTPSYASTPSKPTDWENMKMYTFTGWKNLNNDEFAKDATLPSVEKAETYTAQYNESSVVATVTTSASVTKPYDSFGAAFNAANGSDGNTIKLQANVADDDNTYRSLSRSMTIDLNGYTLSEKHTNTTTYYFYIGGGYTLTINDSREGGKIYFEGTGNANYYTVDVHSGSGVLTVNGGTLEAKSTTASSSYWVAAVQVYNSNSRINLYGGVLIASATSSAKSYTVKHDYSDGKVFVYGGKLKAGTDILGGTVNTSNSTLSGGYYSKAPNGSYTLGSGNALLNVRDDDPNGVSKAEYPYKVAPAHTITFNNWDGTAVQTGASEEGLLPIAPADPTKPNAEGRVYGFTGWSPAVAVVSADATYTAQYEVTGIDADGEAPIAEDITVTTTVVETSGTLNVTAGMLTTTNLILKASESASGQILDGAGTIAATNVYYDLKLNTPARHWHAFGVPWAVNLNTNPLTEVETGRTLVLGRDYDIIWYSTSKRATNGPGAHCWEYVEHNDKTLTPGQGYMIAFTSAVQSVRFVKADGAPIIYNQTVNVSGAGTGDNQGINALANPMAYHATLGAGPTVGYVHDGGEIGSDGYDEYNIENKSYIVGKAVYIQVDSDKPVVVAQSDADPISQVLAPARRKAAAAKQYLSLSDYYHVSIASATTNGGSVYVLPEEDKEDKYVIGHDLAKFGMNSKKPQLWVNRYDTKLGLNTTEPINEVAEFPVSVYAPNAGEYTISLASQPDDEYTVYLMRNGIFIWDLSSGAYVANLEAGVDKTYGLRLDAHRTPTAIDQAVVDAQGETKKVIIEDKVFIIRGNNVYSVDGQLVK